MQTGSRHAFHNMVSTSLGAQGRNSFQGRLIFELHSCGWIGFTTLFPTRGLQKRHVCTKGIGLGDDGIQTAGRSQQSPVDRIVPESISCLVKQRGMTKQLVADGAAANEISRLGISPPYGLLRVFRWTFDNTDQLLILDSLQL